MRALLKLFFALFVLTVLLAITGLFLPNQYKLVEIQEIPVSRNIVYEQIVDFRNWNKWSPLLKDSTIANVKLGKLVKGQQAEMEVANHKNEKVKLTITHAVAPESIAVDFNYGLSSKTTGLWYVEPTSRGCKLNWTLNITKLSLIERYFAILQKKEIEQSMKVGMAELFRESLKLKFSRTGDISSIQMQVLPSVIMLDSVTADKESVRVEEMDKYLKRFFERRELVPGGRPFKLVFGAVNDSLQKVAWGYPIEERTWVWRTLQYYEFPEGEVLTLNHFGLPENTIDAHKKIQDYIQSAGYKNNGTPWEVSFFRNDSLQVDSSMWRTQIFYPVTK